MFTTLDLESYSLFMQIRFNSFLRLCLQHAKQILLEAVGHNSQAFLISYITCSVFFYFGIYFERPSLS